MHTVKPVLPDETISEFMMYHYPVYKTAVFPVIGDDGRIYEVNISDIYKIPQIEWDTVRVLDLSHPVEIFVSPYDTLLKALKLMNRYQVNELPVVYGNTVLGVIKRDVIESLIERYYLQEKLQES
ncbi:MAG: CBS domain-containing protein [Persephonella sp.]|nr:CBS domain-containing protein [Persephonella sp.]